MSYIDGFVVAVPAANKEIYREVAALAAGIFREYGALEVMEAWGEDVPHGTLTDFHRAVQATAEEVVVLSWIVWPSREARDAGHAKFMADPRTQPMISGSAMPFDGKRMIFGGFAPIVHSTGEAA